MPQLRFSTGTLFLVIAVGLCGTVPPGHSMPLHAADKLATVADEMGANDTVADETVQTAEDDSAKPAADAEPRKELFSGRVVLIQAALKRRGIKVADEMKEQVALETAAGELIPIAADWRGRAFFQDERLRNRDVELVGYRRHGVPWMQVLIVYVIDGKAGRQEMDYWCEVCAIPMYEIKECECCQGPIELRLRAAKLPDFLQLDSGKTSAPHGGQPASRSTTK